MSQKTLTMCGWSVEQTLVSQELQVLSRPRWCCLVRRRIDFGAARHMLLKN